MASADRFVQLRKIGEGTFGTVYKVTDTWRGERGERVALKVIQGVHDSSFATKRVLRELTILRLCRCVELLLPLDAPA